MTMKKVLGCIRKADEEFNLIQDGDKVCVGVSGGKDFYAPFILLIII